jgi:hypothetical protein
MYLIYIDESGNTGDRKDPQQPIHLIGGLLVHESKIRSIEDEVRRLTIHHLGVVAVQPGFELHGIDLFKGTGWFKGISPATRIQLIHEVLAALQERGAKVGWAAADKTKLYSGWHPHRLAFILFMERVEGHLSGEDALGLIIADENKEIEQRLIDDLEVYKRTTTGFGWRPIKLEHVVDSIHFVQSKNNRLIQCADMVAYFALRGHRLIQALAERYRAVPEPKSTWPSWRSTNTSPSEQAALAIHERIAAMTVFAKLFP